MSTDTSWSELIDIDQEAARSKMADRFRTIVKLPAAQQDEQLIPMVTSEYSLDGPRLLAFTTTRLRSWIDLDADDAKVIASSYDRVFQHLPGEMAMRRVLAVQTAAREMKADEVAHLRSIIPSMLDAVPVTRRLDAPPVASSEKAKKPFWKFWAKD